MLFLKADLSFIIAMCTLLPIFLLLIFAFVLGLVKRIKLAKKYHKGNVYQGDDELKNKLLEIFGEGNIEKVEVEMSRLTVSVKDIDIVKAEELKNLGANGVLLVGNKVKCSFSENAEEIYNLLK